jgi:hypothetical protein
MNECHRYDAWIKNLLHKLSLRKERIRIAL